MDNSSSPPKRKGVVVSVLNMKGGVGKTTISAHVMRVLYHEHRVRTLLLDLDPQFNLTQCLVKKDRYDELKSEGKTIIKAFEENTSSSIFDVTGGAKPPAVDDLMVRLRFIRNSNPAIDLQLVSGDFDLIKFSLIDDKRKLAIAGQRFSAFVKAARKNFDLVVIDCNPSSSFITKCALSVCTHILVPIRPDKYSLVGLQLVAEYLERLPSIHPKPPISVLLNGIPSGSYDRSIENEVRADSIFGPNVLASRLRASRLLQATPDYTGFATDRPAPYKGKLKEEIMAITSELVEKLGVNQ